MTTDMSYQIQAQDPAVYPFATLYPLMIKTDNTTSASIIITQCNNLTPSILWMNEEIAALQMALKGINVTAREEMIIDNTDGFLLSGMSLAGMGNEPSGFMLYQAQYWLDSKDCECGPVSVGTMLVNIASTYPRKLHESLLNSITWLQARRRLRPRSKVLITPLLNDVPQEHLALLRAEYMIRRMVSEVASAEITVDYVPTRIMTDVLGNYRVKVRPAQHLIGAQSSGYGVIPSSVMVYRNKVTKLDLKAVSRQIG
jgi:hypothetical protein